MPQEVATSLKLVAEGFPAPRVNAYELEFTSNSDFTSLILVTNDILAS